MAPSRSAAVATEGKPRPVITVHGKAHDLSKVRKAQLDAWRAECLRKFPAGGAYQVLYVDPPWQYWGGRTLNLEGQTAYPTMTLEELKRLPVGRAAAPTSVLFLWATNPMLSEAIELARAWGFEYKTVFKVWLKRTVGGTPVVGLGSWSRSSTELLLVATRGKGYMSWKTSRSEPQVFEGPRTRHSEKPAAVRDAVRAFLRVPRRLEVFARTTAPGWDAWGLEVPGFFHRD